MPTLSDLAEIQWDNDYKNISNFSDVNLRTRKECILLLCFPCGTHLGNITVYLFF